MCGPKRASVLAVLAAMPCPKTRFVKPGCDCVNCSKMRALRDSSVLDMCCTKCGQRHLDWIKFPVCVKCLAK